MKHIWCIDDDKFILKEGYVLDDYQDYEDDFVYFDESQKSRIGVYKVGNIFENKETALSVYKVIIKIERAHVHNKIEELKKYDETLSEKLLNL